MSKRDWPSLCGWGTAFAVLAALAFGCESEAPKVTNVEATVSEAISTVVKVHWTTDQPTFGYVTYGLSPELNLRTLLEKNPATEHEALLLGLTATTTYYYRVVVTDDENNAAASDLQTITTGDLPLGLPSLTKTGAGHDQFIITPILGATTAVTIINPDGQFVWYHVDDRDLDIYRARLSVDGKSILYNAASVSGDPAENSEIVRVSLDGTVQTGIPIPLLAHDFVELPDGTIAAIAVEYRDVGGEQLRGDKIVEVAPDGTQSIAWSVWDCFDPVTDPGDDMVLGWTFANALDYDPVEDAYYLGMRNLSSIVKIDRATKQCLWVLGGPAATISFASGSSRFMHEHQFEVLDQGILVFDNEGSAADESRVIEYAIDWSTNTATEVWSYTATPSLYTFVLGEPTRLNNGDTFINWSTAGQMELVDKDGISKWQINSPMSYAFGFHTLAKSLYQD